MAQNCDVLVLIETVVQGIVDGGSENVVRPIQDGVESIHATGDLVEGDVEAIRCEESKLIRDRVRRGRGTGISSVSVWVIGSAGKGKVARGHTKLRTAQSAVHQQH